jgi:DNA-binding NarL/FixJ family response regulator
MPNIAIFARESARRGALEAVARVHGTLVDGAGDLAALQRLVDRHAIDLAVLGDHALRCVILGNEEDGAELALAGAAAVLPSDASAAIVGAAIALAAQGLRLLPDRAFRSLAGIEIPPSADDAPVLTPREREVLAAMADGAPNKVIARRLGISFHTAKFHVASILTKLDAETRTEALARAARMGLVML